MGKKAEFTRSRFKEVRQKHEERMQRSQTERDRRHGIDKSDRKIDKVLVQRPLPNDAQQTLLITQFAQACRLAAPSKDMCLLMRHYAAATQEAKQKSDSTTEMTTSAALAKSATRKRKRDETEEAPAAGNAFLDNLADALIQTQSTPVVVDEEAAAANTEKDRENDVDDDDDDEDPVTVLQDILQDDSGRRVVATLLASLNIVHSAKCNAVAKVVLEQFEENEYLPQHHVACRVMSALVQFGSDATRQGVLNLLRQRGTTTEAVERLLSDRHTAGTIDQLLKNYSQATVAWLCEVLCLSTPAAGSGGKKKTSKPHKAPAEAAGAAGEEVTTEKLMELINGPVSGQVLLQLVHTDARRELLKRLSITDLLQSKRGTAFLTQLLTLSSSDAVDGTQEEEAVALFNDVLERLGKDLGEMAIDKRANFVVQGLVQLLPAMGAQSAKHQERLERALGGAAGISALVEHGNGVHVVLSLIDTSLKLPSECSVEGLAEKLITRQNITDRLQHKYGSLVVRRLMPLISRKASKVGRLLQGIVEQEMSSLVYTEAGNLVVNSYLTALGKSGASLLAQKLARGEDLFFMCQSPYASHVVFSLFELVDPTTHTVLCNALKPHVLPLSTHVNGRFIVEKMIAASRDVREDVLRRFLSLAQERGTQHLLCALLANMDTRGKQACVDKTIMPNLSNLATHQYGSIVLQKLMQAEPTVLSAVQQRLASNSLVRSDLAQNFFGKFVVQIAAQSEQVQH